MDDKRRALKKFVQDYAVAITTSVVLIVILGVLVLARQIALSGVKDISKINPLITSKQNKLVASADSSEIVKIPNDSAAQGGQSGSTGSNVKSPGSTSSTSSSKSNSTGSSGGSGGSSTSGGGSTTSSTPTPSPSPTVQPFSASIGQLSYTSSSSYGVKSGCKTTYDFQAVIQGSNAPGSVSYRWVQSDGTTGGTQWITFSQGDTSKTVTYEWTIGGNSGNYSVTFQLLTPTTQQKTVQFQQGCSLL